MSIAEQMLDAFSQRMQQAEAGHAILPGLELFRHVQQQQQLFVALMRGPGEAVLWKAGQTTLSRKIEHSLASAFAGNRSPSVPLPVISQYVAGPFLNLLKWWLEAEMPYSPERMDEMFQQLALPGVWAAVGEDGNT